MYGNSSQAYIIREKRTFVNSYGNWPNFLKSGRFQDPENIQNM